MERITDIILVHTVLITWICPMLLCIGGITSLVYDPTNYISIYPLMLYALGKVVSDTIDTTSPSGFRQLQIAFQTSFTRYFRMNHLTPSVVVPTSSWSRPQVIMTGPHGVFNMGGIRSILTSDHTEKNIICAIAPIMGYTWFQLILRLAGTHGMLPLDHGSVQQEMSRGTRDIMVIPGGYVETNTGNEHGATMDSSKWDYWLLQCARHGYDASFQWIHGATQVYHTGQRGLALRRWCGEKGIPCVFPVGQWNTPLAHHDVQMSTCGFRMSVTKIPDVTRDTPEFRTLVATFRARVHDLVTVQYPPQPSLHQAPVELLPTSFLNNSR